MPQTSQSEIEHRSKVTEIPIKSPGTTEATTTHLGLESNVSPYGLFSKLPGELRILVWNGVLESKRDVSNAFKFMTPQQPLMVATCPPNNDIDSAILRTSRAIYGETFPILYGKNRFVFYAPGEIPTFAFGELCKTFGFSSLSDPLRDSFERLGRLSMFHSVTLDLSKPSPSRFSNHLQGNEAIWSVWAEFFQPSSEQQSLPFPVLEDLCLKFSQWELDASDASKLRIEPILRKLRPSGGLQRFWVFGVKHEQNLNDFKHGFLKEGGKLKARDNQNTLIAEGIVSYSDLHTVSKGVRDILQRDGVSALCW